MKLIVADPPPKSREDELLGFPWPGLARAFDRIDGVYAILVGDGERWHYTGHTIAASREAADEFAADFVRP